MVASKQGGVTLACKGVPGPLRGQVLATTLHSVIPLLSPDESFVPSSAPPFASSLVSPSLTCPVCCMSPSHGHLGTSTWPLPSFACSLMPSIGPPLLLQHPLCLSREFDLSKTWNKYAVDSLFLKEWSMAEMLCLAVMWFPWPLSNVNMLFSVVGIDLLEEHGCFLTSLHTPSALQDNVTIPAHLASNPSVDVRQGSFVAMEPLQPAQPGGSPRTRVTMVLHVDPHLTFVPQFIITFVLKVMAPFMHSVVVKLLTRIFHDPHSAIAKRLRERASLYDLVRKRCAKHLQHLQQADKQ
ncbi:hypothetical protein V8C86DRAFT_2465022 [Haematococcus lacustris]